MGQTTFIGIVPSQGSKECNWNGAFEFDEVEGYKGKLLSTSFEPKIGQHIFSTPADLDKKVLYCLIDGSQFGTIIWPELRGVQIKNFTAQIRDLRIKTLIKGVHIDETEKDIKKIVLQSSIFLFLFRLSTFKETIETTPYKLIIESLDQKDLEFSSSFGKLSLGISPSYSLSRNHTAPSLEAISYFSIELEPAITAIDALKIIRKFEHLISLLSFSFVRIASTRLSISLTTPAEDASPNQTFQLDRAKITKNAKTELDWDDVLFDLSDVDFGSLASRFFETFDKIEQTLNWYRIVTIEDRYVEDKFFYSVRMIEALYKAIGLRTNIDPTASEAIEKIKDVLRSSTENEELVSFLQQRTVPIFSRPSLGDILADLRERYSDLKSIEILDSRIINKLRGKEAHGSTQRFSGQEYQYMVHIYEVIRLLYVLIVLEHCGMSRAYLVKHLQDSHKYGRYFTDEILQEFHQTIGSAK